MRLKLGPTTATTLADARKEAKKRLGGMHHGVDPARDLRPSQGPTVGEVVNAYLAAAALSPATSKEWRRIADVELAPIKDRPAKDLKRSEIRELGATICRRSGYTANRVYVVLRAAFAWAAAQDIIETTPFVGLKQPFLGERRSDRVLSADELRALVFVLDELRKPKREVKYLHKKTQKVKTRTETGGDHYADALALLMFTGVRRRAVIEARSSELFSLEEPDGKDAAGVAEWRIAPAHLKMRETLRKNAKPHVVPLSRQAAAIFRHRIRAVGGSEILFPRMRAARSRGQAGAYWSSRWIRKLHERMSELLGAPVLPWKVHNLRHTLATHIEEDLKVAQAITAGILGHSQGRGVTSRYALAQHLVERRAALQAWADWLDGLRRSSFKVAGGTER
jgi:integrase